MNKKKQISALLFFLVLANFLLITAIHNHHSSQIRDNCPICHYAKHAISHLPDNDVSAHAVNDNCYLLSIPETDIWDYISALNSFSRDPPLTNREIEG